ncbi:Histidinol-phosphate aminotransferase [hydrothermal vent metagenome]|uniref:Histidinol-phosphate aminotransferase n=1 Tax=hydrothermal vent metagenome TaxID=652676 RepID=A0A3B1BKH3_9ZZZZ
MSSMKKDTSSLAPRPSSPRDRIAQWIRPQIRKLSAYHVADASGLIKLDAMENPYHWPQDKIDQWLELLRNAELNRYPDPHARQLKDRLREVMAVPADASVLLGNGSDEIIQMIVMAMSGEGRSVLSVDPGFVMYRMIADFCGMDYIGVPLREDFSLDAEAVLAAIKQHQPAVVFLAYPNNPTGNLFARADMLRIIAAAPGVVVVDEAYHAFAEDSFMPLLAEHENLLLMRTVSKMGLAGLRLGMLAGARQWLEEFDKVRLPYNINVLTQLSAGFALQHAAMLDAQTQQIKQNRAELYTQMQALKGLTVFPSQANFILFRVSSGRAGAVFEGLKAAGVLIKNMHKAGPLLRDCLRVTVGTDKENAAFLQALAKLDL